MQDNEHKHFIDEQFTDQAWSNMSSMLDQEMPLNESSGFASRIWIPMLVVGAFLGGFLSAYLFLQSDSPTLPEIPSAPTPAIAETIIPSSNQGAPEPEKEIVYIYKTIEKPVYITSSNTNSIENNIHSTYSNINNPPAKKPDYTISSEEVKKSPGQAQEISKNHSPLKKLYNPFQSVHPNRFTLDKSYTQTAGQSSLLSKIRPDKVGIFFGIQTKQGQVVDGIATGFYLHYKLYKSFWLGTGAGYDYQLKNDYLNYTNSVLSDFKKLFPNSYYVNPVYALKSVHHLNIPLTIGYQYKSFRLNAGVEYSRILKVSKKNDLLIPFTSRRADVVKAESANASNSVEYQAWNKNQYSGILGLTYQPTRSLALNLRYKYSPRSLTKESYFREQLYNNYAQVSLLWYLKNKK